MILVFWHACPEAKWHTFTHVPVCVYIWIYTYMYAYIRMPFLLMSRFQALPQFLFPSFFHSLSFSTWLTHSPSHNPSVSANVWEDCSQVTAWQIVSSWILSPSAVYYSWAKCSDNIVLKHDQKRLPNQQRVCKAHCSHTSLVLESSFALLMINHKSSDNSKCRSPTPGK